MKAYEVLIEIPYAACKYNPGKIVMMTDTRAKKYLDKNQIKLAEQPAAKKEAKS